MILSQKEAFARIRLLRSANVGPVTYRQLIRRFGNAETVLLAMPDMAARGGNKYKLATEHSIETEIERLRGIGGRYIFHDSPDYPPLLCEVESGPPILIALGDGKLVHQPCVAIVGARNASIGAQKLAWKLGADLAANGIAVVSGLARGIDGAAHEGVMSLKRDKPLTIGVIASGLDKHYPPEHFDLQEKIGAHGLLLTEHPPGVEPLSRHFPARNRIIAGMCVGTIVVEAAPRSGSLITARLAGEYGREVMAVPGSPLDSRSHGCNMLIREGAILVQSAEDIIELISGFDGIPRSVVREEAHAWADISDGDNAVEASPAERIAPVSTENMSLVLAEINNLMSTAPISIDELVRSTKASISDVQMALLDLELGGALIRHSGGRVSLSSE